MPALANFADQRTAPIADMVACGTAGKGWAGGVDGQGENSFWCRLFTQRRQQTASTTAGRDLQLVAEPAHGEAHGVTEGP